mmetsp:Transcript_29376/g.64218  ORF Transcript_29376/g.64218 Transcript_29376/m.64218 type:complete len:519 (-) Transcript_29376:178-1734(-)
MKVAPATHIQGFNEVSCVGGATEVTVIDRADFNVPQARPGSKEEFQVEDASETSPSSAKRPPLSGAAGGTKRTLGSVLKGRKKEQTNTVEVRGQERKRIEQLFYSLDRDNDGFLTHEEIEKGFQSFKENAIRQDLLVNSEVMDQVMEVALKNCDRDADGLLDVEEFVGIWIKESPGIFESHHWAFSCFFCFMYFALAPLVFIPLNVSEDGTSKRWSLWDALYFAAVTVTTVGYGDLKPLNDGMKLFTIVYIIFGLGIVSQFVSDFTKAILVRYEQRMQQFNAKLMEGVSSTGRGSMNNLPNDVGGNSSSSSLGDLSPIRRFYRKVVLNFHAASKYILAAVLFVLPVAVGTIFFMLNENWSFLDSLYWSIVTCTTVGYGDLTLTKESSRAFSFFYILIGFAFVGAAIGHVGTIQMERTMELKHNALLSRSLSLDLLSDFDKDGNGVDRCEFVCAMLVQLGKVSEDDLVPLLNKFDELDADGSGVLTQDDLRVLRRQKQAKQLAKKQASRGGKSGGALPG